MLTRLRHLRRDERGMSFVYVGMGFMAFLSATTLAIDVGMFMTARTQAQTSADADAYGIELRRAECGHRGDGDGGSRAGERHEVCHAVHDSRPMVRERRSQRSLDAWRHVRSWGCLQRPERSGHLQRL